MIRRSKIKAKPIIKKSQATVAKSKPQNPKPSEPDPVSSQPESGPLNVIKTGDDSPGLSTSISNENPTTDISKTTGEETVSDHHAHARKSQQDKVTPSSSCMIPLSSNISAAEPQRDEVSTMSEPIDIAVCNVTKEASREVDSNVNVNQPAVEININESPLPTSATVSTIDDAPTENTKTLEKKKSTIPGGRRRKIMACPTAGKKRRKTDAKSEGTKQIKNSDASNLPSDVPNPQTSAPTDSSTSKTIVLPENAESTDMVTLHLEKCDVPVQSSKDVVLVDVAALTTINEVPLSQLDNSPIFGIDSSNDKSVTEDSPTALTGNSICLPSCEAQQVELGKSDSVQQMEVEPKIPHPKKCVVKIKTKSLSSKYRTLALEKLNRLKENQPDGSEWPELDQNYVSMSDLIFLNPPPKVGHKLGMNADQEETTESVIQQPAATTETSETVEDSATDKPLPVPQIRIAEDGTVVVDEESLVLDTQKPEDPTIRTVYESGRDTCINQRSFMRRSFAKGIRWTAEETNEFYRCLRIVGAEFSLMSAMFRGRSPDDLRRKFRREHKNNPVRVDEALKQQHLSKWTDDMFKAKEPNPSSILKPPSETPAQS